MRKLTDGKQGAAQKVAFRLSGEDVAVLDRLCTRWDCTRSEAVRRALRAALSDSTQGTVRQSSVAPAPLSDNTPNTVRQSPQAKATEPSETSGKAWNEAAHHQPKPHEQPVNGDPFGRGEDVNTYDQRRLAGATPVSDDEDLSWLGKGHTLNKR